MKASKKEGDFLTFYNGRKLKTSKGIISMIAIIVIIIQTWIWVKREFTLYCIFCNKLSHH